MNKIAIINGSPKARDSVSGIIIEQIAGIVKESVTVYQALKLARQEDPSAALRDILTADALLFVFPLYVDSLPAPLVKTLTLIEEAGAARREQRIRVYAISNCGFYEAAHNRLALNIIENFSSRAGMTWGYGVGVGSGGFIYSQRRNMAKGPAAGIYSVFCDLGKSIQSGETAKQNVFVTAKIPRFLYSFMGNLGWRLMAKRYKAGNQLKARPHLSR